MSGKGLLGRADYSFGPGSSPTAGAALATLTTVAIVAPLYEADLVPPYWGAVAGFMVAMASAIAVAGSRIHRLHEGRAMLYRGACWFGAGIWAWWQLDHHPWSWSGLLGLVVGGVTAAIVGSALQHGENKEHEKGLDEAEKALAEDNLRRHADIAQRWEALFAKVTNITVKIVNVRLWDDGTGYTLDFNMPLDGTTIDDVKPHEAALATAAGLKPGCNVLITPPDSDDVPRYIGWARINTVNAMKQDQPLPEDWSERTINDPIPLGVVADRSLAGVDLRENCMALAGQRGSGKSTTLNVLIKGLGQCTDTIILMVDLKGGGDAARRWVRAWREERADKPVLCLVANTEELARLMMLGVRNIVDGRPVAYADLMHQQGTDKILPARDLPEIIVVCDEFKSLPDDVKDHFEYVGDKGRASAVNFVACTLDPTNYGIPTEILIQCRERYACRVSDERQIHYLFDGGGKWRQQFDTRSMTDPGMALLSTNGQDPIQIKGWWQEMKDIDATSIRLAPMRPDLDEASIQMFDTVVVPGRKGEEDVTITGLWERFWPMTLDAMFPNGGGGSTQPSPPPAPPARRTATSAQAMNDAMGAVGTAMSEIDDAGARLREAMAGADGEQGGGDDAEDEPADDRPASVRDPHFDEVVQGFEAKLPARTRYEQLLRDFQPTGATEIRNQLKAEGYPTSRQTVQDWLSEDEALGKAEKTSAGWIWRKRSQP